MIQIPQDFLDQLQSRVVLSQVIGARLTLKKKGRIWLGLCPFHNPSFNVNDAQNSYHCFGCGAHGDAISFLRETEKLDFIEAVERLAQMVGMTMPRLEKENPELTKQRTGIYEALEAACALYQQQLRHPRGQAALQYFYDRGLDNDTIHTFRLGYAPEGGHLTKTLLAAGFSKRTLVDAGLIIADDERREPFERFRDRVIFPIRDSKGRVVAFGGRLMGPGEPKYLNSPETEVFQKGRIVYGSDRLSNARKDNHVIIVAEGYMDVISLYRAGFMGAVAPLGTALTPDQVQILWRYHESPILCFDGDTAGVKASHRALVRLLPVLKPGHTVKVSLLPQGLDPDDLVRQGGAAAINQVLNQAQTLIESLWLAEVKQADTTTPEKRAAFERHLLQLADSIADPVVKKYYRDDLSNRLRDYLQQQPRPASFKQAALKTRGRNPGQQHYKGSTIALPSPRAGYDALLALTLHHPRILEVEGERFAHLHFPDSRMQRLQAELLSWSLCAMDLNREAFLAYLHSRPDAMAAQEAIVQYLDFADKTLSHDMQFDQVQQAWAELYRRTHDTSALEQELRDLQVEMAENFTPELWSRIQSIKATLENLRSADETDSFAQSDM